MKTDAAQVVYVGGDNDEIAIYRMHPETGDLLLVKSEPAGHHPSFLAFTPSKRFAYAVNEFSDEVASFAVDDAAGGQRGGLSFMNRVPSRGRTPAFVSVDRSGRWALVANYDGGTVAVFPIQSDGRLGAPTDTRTTGKHPHAIRTDTSNELVFVPNKGSDTISQFSLDGKRGRLVPNTPPELALPKGAEPRHLEFHPTDDFVYVVDEAGSSVHLLALDRSTGTLSHVERVSTLPPDAGRVANTGADLHLSPSGTFLYGSNRGHDSIVIYSVGREGKLTLVGHESTRGKTPRNFGIDPSGTFLFAANQDSDTVATFRIDPARGTLEHSKTTPMKTSPYWIGVVAFGG
jgi:6-phosphogluconolactonase